MSIFADNKELGAGVNHRITFNGALQDWDTKALQISSLTNEASTFDDRRRISDLTITMADTDNSIWLALGNGTSAFGKGLTVTTTIGGTFGVKTFGQVQGYGQRGTEGGTTYTTHMGSVVEVSRRARTVTIRSKNNMDRLNDLTFKFPINTTTDYLNPSGSYLLNYQDFSFQGDGEAISERIRVAGGINISDDRSAFTFYGYPYNTGDTITAASDGFYDGSVVTVGASYYVCTDAFYREHSLLKFTGSYLGTVYGTITELDTALSYGFTSLANAETSVTKDGNGTRYAVNKLKYKWANGTQQPFDRVAPISHIAMESDYVDILKYLICGRFVYRKFASTDLDTVSFAKSSAVAAFNTFRGTIYTDETKVIDHIDDIVKITNAMFSVTNNNQFAYLSYAPVEIQGDLGTILQKDVISTEINNSKEDAYNRFELSYKYDKNSDSYGTINRQQLTDWNLDNDRLLSIDTKWLFDDNEANAFMKQVKTRYNKTVPIINVTTPLNKGAIEIGDLVRCTHVDTGMSNKVLQVRKFTKDFANSKTIDFECLDGESVYYGRGWAFYGSQTVIPITVTTVEKSGFSDNALGTVHNINEPLYGSVFRYW